MILRARPLKATQEKFWEPYIETKGQNRRPKLS